MNQNAFSTIHVHARWNVSARRDGLQTICGKQEVNEAEVEKSNSEKLTRRMQSMSVAVLK